MSYRTFLQNADFVPKDSPYHLTTLVHANTGFVEFISLEDKASQNIDNFDSKDSSLVTLFSTTPNPLQILENFFPNNIQLKRNGEEDNVVSVLNFSDWESSILNHQRAKSLVLTNTLLDNSFEILKLQMTFTVNWLNEFILNIVFKNTCSPQGNNSPVLNFNFTPNLWVKADEKPNNNLNQKTSEKNTSSLEIDADTNTDASKRLDLFETTLSQQITLQTNRKVNPKLNNVSEENSNEPNQSKKYWSLDPLSLNLLAGESQRLSFILRFV